MMALLHISGKKNVHATIFYCYFSKRAEINSVTDYKVHANVDINIENKYFIFLYIYIYIYIENDYVK